MKKPKRELTVELSAASLANELRQGYSMKVFDAALPGSPRDDVVKAALELMVKWKLANRALEEKYRVHFKALRGGTLEWFLRRLVGRDEKESKRKDRYSQPTLPLE